MVTTTTKTLNYSITKGNNTNSVNATITSTPGFNTNYLGKIPGILKLLELALAITALVLIAVERKEDRLTNKYQQNENDVAITGKGLLWQVEMFLVGEVYFLCAHSVVIAVLLIILIAYLFHTTSAMIVPKATTVENVQNLVLALLLLAAGIVEIVLVVHWRDTLNRERADYAAYPVAKGAWEKAAADAVRAGAQTTPSPPATPVPGYPTSFTGVGALDDFPNRIAAAVLALLNGLLFIGSFVLSRKELAGPKTL